MLIIVFLFALFQLTATTSQCSSTISIYSDTKTLVDYYGALLPSTIMTSYYDTPCGPTAIWTSVEFETGTFIFHRKIFLPDWTKEILNTAQICVQVDDTFKLYLGGELMGSGVWKEVVTIDLKKKILAATGNEIELVFEVWNWGGPAWLNYRLDLGLA